MDRRSLETQHHAQDLSECARLLRRSMRLKGVDISEARPILHDPHETVAAIDHAVDSLLGIVPQWGATSDIEMTKAKACMQRLNTVSTALDAARESLSEAFYALSPWLTFDASGTLIEGTDLEKLDTTNV